jgi:hypothetical protein
MGFKPARGSCAVLELASGRGISYSTTSTMLTEHFLRADRPSFASDNSSTAHRVRHTEHHTFRRDLNTPSSPGHYRYPQGGSQPQLGQIETRAMFVTSPDSIAPSPRPLDSGLTVLETPTATFAWSRLIPFSKMAGPPTLFVERHRRRSDHDWRHRLSDTPGYATRLNRHRRASSLATSVGPMTGSSMTRTE